MCRSHVGVRSMFSPSLFPATAFSLSLDCLSPSSSRALLPHSRHRRLKRRRRQQHPVVSPETDPSTPLLRDTVGRCQCGISRQADAGTRLESAVALCVALPHRPVKPFAHSAPLMHLLLRSHQDAAIIMGTIFTLLLGVLLQGVSCLRLLDLDVPESIFVGQIARLSCLFDEEHDDLYSVKWYKDDVEFFRFLPNDRPANQFFSIGDVDVDMSRSSNGTVFLRNTNRSAEGNYRCEVSADAPSFQSISSEKYMSVEDRPPPRNTANKHQLLLKDIIIFLTLAYSYGRLIC